MGRNLSRCAKFRRKVESMNKSEIAEKADEFAANLPEECWGYTVNHKQFVKALTLFGERAIAESQAPVCRNPNHALVDGGASPHEIGPSCMAECNRKTCK